MIRQNKGTDDGSRAVLTYTESKLRIFSTDFGSRIFGLDIMRAAAILMVVISHGIHILTPYIPDLNFLGGGGFWGVEMFFVLSGFLIGYILIRQINENPFTLNSIVHFWKRRWFRTLPNYFLILFLNIGLFLLLGGKAGYHFLHYFLFIQNFKEVSTPFFPESWSLAIEEWFYLTLPISFFLISIIGKKRKDKKSIIKITLIIFFLLPLLFRFYQGIYKGELIQTIAMWDRYIRRVTVARLDALMFGVLMAYMKFYHKKIFHEFKNIMFFSGCIVLAGCVYMYYSSPVNLFFKTLYFSFVSFGFALLLPYLNAIKDGPKFIVVPITHISIISYSMYLLYLSLIFNPLRPYLIASNLYEALIIFTGYMGLTIGIATLLYSFYEKPMTDLRDKFAYSRT